MRMRRTMFWVGLRLGLTRTRFAFTIPILQAVLCDNAAGGMGETGDSVRRFRHALSVQCDGHRKRQHAVAHHDRDFIRVYRGHGRHVPARTPYARRQTVAIAQLHGMRPTVARPSAHVPDAVAAGHRGNARGLGEKSMNRAPFRLTAPDGRALFLFVERKSRLAI